MIIKKSIKIEHIFLLFTSLFIIISFFNNKALVAIYYLFFVTCIFFSYTQKLLNNKNLLQMIKQPICIIILLLSVYTITRAINTQAPHTFAPTIKILTFGISFSFIKNLLTVKEFTIKNKIIVTITSLILLSAVIIIIDIITHSAISKVLLNKSSSYKTLYWYSSIHNISIFIMGGTVCYSLYTKQYKFFTISTLLTVIISIILNKYYTSYFALILATLTLFIIINFSKKYALIFIILCLFLYCVGSPFIYYIMLKYEVLDKLPSISGSMVERFFIWSQLVQDGFNYPIFGHGSNFMRNILEIKASTALEQQNYYYPNFPKFYHGHNFPLQIFYELGIVGSFIFFIINYLIIKYIINTNTPKIVYSFLIANHIYSLGIMFGSYALWSSWWLASLIFEALFILFMIQSMKKVIN